MFVGTEYSVFWAALFMPLWLWLLSKMAAPILRRIARWPDSKWKRFWGYRIKSLDTPEKKR